MISGPGLRRIEHLAETMPAYAELLERIRSGGPMAPAVVPTAPTAPEVVAIQEWYAGLPESVRIAARDCPLRVVEPMRGCCMSNATVCRGGPHDGQVVDVASCAACKSATA